MVLHSCGSTTLQLRCREQPANADSSWRILAVTTEPGALRWIP